MLQHLVVVLALNLLVWTWCVPEARAQFLRLGPFDVTAGTGIDFIYTTNVDGVRKGESELEQEDYYLVWSLSASIDGPTTPTAELRADTSMSIEKHFVRDDLDNVDDPFGNLLLTHNLELGRFQLPSTLQFRRENTADQDETTRIVIPGRRRRRIVEDTRTFTQGLLWQRDPLSWNLNYSYEEKRYPDPEFAVGDQNNQTFDFSINWNVLNWGGQSRLDLFYTYGTDRTDFVNRPEGSGEWEESESQGLNLNVQILQRPNTTYTLAYEKSDTDEDWRITHTLSIADRWELSPTMTMDASASYKIDEQPEDDDVQFQYNVGIAHEITPTVSQQARFQREPVDTFGSTADTDQTTWTYTFTKRDLLFANVTFTANVQYEVNRPGDAERGPTERLTTYTAALSHSRSLSPRLSRTFGYQYNYETSNLESQPIEEHEVRWGYNMSF